MATAVTAGRLVLGGQAAFVAWLQRMRHCLERAACRPRHGTCWACAADNALDGSIMEWGGQPGAAGITVNLAWLAAAAGRAGRAEEALSGESPGIRPGSLADTIGVALQTWPASPREHGQHHPRGTASTFLRVLPASPCKPCQHLSVSVAPQTVGGGRAPQPSFPKALLAHKENIRAEQPRHSWGMLFPERLDTPAAWEQAGSNKPHARRCLRGASHMGALLFLQRGTGGSGSPVAGAVPHPRSAHTRALPGAIPQPSSTRMRWRDNLLLNRVTCYLLYQAHAACFSAVP